MADLRRANHFVKNIALLIEDVASSRENRAT